MLSVVTELPWKFLQNATDLALRNYELSRLNLAANLRGEISALVDQWLRESVAAELARLILERRAEIEAAAQRQALNVTPSEEALLTRAAPVCSEAVPPEAALPAALAATPPCDTPDRVAETLPPAFVCAHAAAPPTIDIDALQTIATPTPAVSESADLACETRQSVGQRFVRGPTGRSVLDPLPGPLNACSPLAEASSSSGQMPANPPPPRIETPHAGAHARAAPLRLPSFAFGFD